MQCSLLVMQPRFIEFCSLAVNNPTYTEAYTHSLTHISPSFLRLFLLCTMNHMCNSKSVQIIVRVVIFDDWTYWKILPPNCSTLSFAWVCVNQTRRKPVQTITKSFGSVFEPFRSKHYYENACASLGTSSHGEIRWPTLLESWAKNLGR